MAAGSLSGAACTLATTGVFGAAMATLAERFGHGAGGRLHQRAVGTGRTPAGGRRAERPSPWRSRRRARRPPSRPTRTTCPPPLSLAAWQTSPCAASAAAAAAASKSSPSSAAIAPCPGGTAACMALPRMRSRRAVSAMEKAPTAANAEYSPSECPATKAAFARQIEPRLRLQHTHHGEADRHQRRCAFAVRVSSASGPSNISVESFWPSASSTSPRRPRGPRETPRRAPCPCPRPGCPAPERCKRRSLRRSVPASFSARGTCTLGGVESRRSASAAPRLPPLHPLTLHTIRRASQRPAGG